MELSQSYVSKHHQLPFRWRISHKWSILCCSSCFQNSSTLKSFPMAHNPLQEQQASHQPAIYHLSTLVSLPFLPWSVQPRDTNTHNQLLLVVQDQDSNPLPPLNSAAVNSPNIIEVERDLYLQASSIYCYVLQSMRWASNWVHSFLVLCIFTHHKGTDN